MPNVNLTTLDLTVMGIYVVVLIGWGLYHSSRTSAEAYFLGDRGMAWWLVGLSMFSTVVSSSSLVGWAGDAYSTGISVFDYGLFAGNLPIIFVLVFFLPFYLRNNIYTLPEFLEQRYDVRSRYYLSIISILGYTFLDLAVTLYAGALMLQMVFPSAGLATLVWGLAILAASYTIVGGLAAVMWVDLLQAAVLLIGSAILTVTAFSKAGGWTAVMHAVPPAHLSLIRPASDPSVPWPTLLLSMPIIGFYYWGCSQSMVQRTLSAKNIDHGRWGSLLAALMNFSIFFVMVLPGIAGRVLYPHLDRPDQIYPKMVFEMLPSGLTGLVVIGFLAALTAVLSGILNSACTLVTMDLVVKAKRGLTSRQLVIVGNISGMAIMAVAAFWAPEIARFDSLVKYFQQLLSYISPPVVVVFLAGLFWHRANSQGAFAALLSGLAFAGTFLGLRAAGVDTPLDHVHFLYVAPAIFAATAFILVIVSLLTPAPEPSKLERCLWRPSIFTAETRELAGVPWHRNSRILSILLIAIMAVFVYIWR